MQAVERPQSIKVRNRNQLMDFGVSIQNDGRGFGAPVMVKTRLKRGVQGVQTLMKVGGKKKEIWVLNAEPVAPFMDSTFAEQQNLPSCEKRINGNRPLL